MGFVYMHKTLPRDVNDPFLWKSNNSRQFAPNRMTKSKGFWNEDLKIKKQFSIYSILMTLYNFISYYVSLLIIFEKNTHDFVCFVYSYSTTQVNVTSKYLYVSGQGSPPKTLFETVILQLDSPSHLLLTTVSDDVDLQSVLFMFLWGQTFRPSVLP